LKIQPNFGSLKIRYFNYQNGGQLMG